MGIIVKRMAFSNDYNKLVIHISDKKQKFSDAVSLNKPFSRELLNVAPEKRSMQIEDCLYRFLLNYDENTIIKDLDVLFNPSYKIDVISVLINIYKRRKFSVLWSGRLDNGNLVYGEEGYEDYKVFNINCYDIICVI